MAREVVTFFTLPPGDYIVVPQTNIPNLDGKFLLRVFTDEQSNIWEVNEDNMIIRNISTEFMEENAPVTVLIPTLFLINCNLHFLEPEGKTLVTKLLTKFPPEVDASQLQKILRAHWKSYLSEKPSLELCKSLIMLRDYNISGRLNLMDIPVLMRMLQFWRVLLKQKLDLFDNVIFQLAFQKFERGHGNGKTSSYHLRALLWEAGCTVSNKVLECLVLRFAKNRILTTENYVMALVRLHLSHERYHNIDTKMKSNPLSLEEVSYMIVGLFILL